MAAPPFDDAQFARDIKEAVEQGVLAALARTSGQSISSLQRAPGFTVAPAGKAPEVERPVYNRGGGLTGLVAHGTNLLAHQVHQFGQGRISAEYDHPRHLAQANQEAQDELKAAMAEHTRIVQQEGAGSSNLGPAWQRVKAARAVLNSPAQLQARATQLGSEAASGVAGSRSTRGLSGVIGGLTGMGTEGGLLGGIAEAAGPWGLAIAGGAELARKAPDVLDEIANQREKNAQFQSIYGGTNMAGMGQRFSQESFRLTHMGDLTGAQAQEAFQGISQFGIQGAQRTQMLDQMVKEYNKYGLAISDTLKLMTTNIQNGNESLAGLSESIDKVATSAKASGVNVSTMVQGLGTQMQSAAPLYGASGQVTAAQTGIVTAAANGGQTMAKALQAGAFQGFNSQTFQNLIVGRSGMSAGQVSAIAQGNGQQFSQLAMGTIESILGETPLLQSAITVVSNYLADPRHKGTTPQMLASSNEMQTLVQQWQAQEGNNIYALLPVLQGMGFNMDLNTASNWIMQIALSKVTKGQAGFNLGAPGQTGSGMTTGQSSDFSKMSFDKGSIFYKNTNKALSSAEVTDLTNIGVSNSGGALTGKNWGSAVTSEQRRYVQDFYSKGNRDTNLEALLQQGKWNNTKFNITDNTGNVLEGKTLDQIMDLYKSGKVSQQAIDAASVVGDGERNKGIRGESLTDLAGGKTVNGGGGSVTIGLTPEAQYLVKVAQTTGNVANNANMPQTGTTTPAFNAATQGSS
jgi:hypothetical protein